MSGYSGAIALAVVASEFGVRHASFAAMLWVLPLFEAIRSIGLEADFFAGISRTTLAAAAHGRIWDSCWYNGYCETHICVN